MLPDAGLHLRPDGQLRHLGTELLRIFFGERILRLLTEHLEGIFFFLDGLGFLQNHFVPFDRVAQLAYVL